MSLVFVFLGSDVKRTTTGASFLLTQSGTLRQKAELSRGYRAKRVSRGQAARGYIEIGAWEGLGGNHHREIGGGRFRRADRNDRPDELETGEATRALEQNLRGSEK